MIKVRNLNRKYSMLISSVAIAKPRIVVVKGVDVVVVVVLTKKFLTVNFSKLQNGSRKVRFVEGK